MSEVRRKNAAAVHAVRYAELNRITSQSVAERIKELKQKKGMENEGVIEEDRIIVCDQDENGGALEYDIHYLHPDLGVLIQEYSVSSTTYEGKNPE